MCSTIARGDGDGGFGPLPNLAGGKRGEQTRFAARQNLPLFQPHAQAAAVQCGAAGRGAAQADPAHRLRDAQAPKRQTHHRVWPLGLFLL